MCYSVYFEHSQYYTPVKELGSRPNGGVSVLKNKKVIKIEPGMKVAFLEDGTAIRYNKCLIATGKWQQLLVKQTKGDFFSWAVQC